MTATANLPQSSSQLGSCSSLTFHPDELSAHHSIIFIIHLYYISHKMRNHSTLLHFEAAKGHPDLKSKEILESETEMAHTVQGAPCPLQPTPIHLLSLSKEKQKIFESSQFLLMTNTVTPSPERARQTPVLLQLLPSRRNDSASCRSEGINWRLKCAINCWNSIYFNGSCVAQWWFTPAAILSRHKGFVFYFYWAYRSFTYLKIKMLPWFWLVPCMFSSYTYVSPRQR